MNDPLDKLYKDFSSKVNAEKERIITEALEEIGYKFGDNSEKLKFISSRCNVSYGSNIGDEVYFLDGIPFLKISSENKFVTDNSDRKHVVTIITTFTGKLL